MKVVFVALGAEQLAISLLSAVVKREGHETALAFNPALFDDRYFLDIPFLARAFDQSWQVVDQIVAEKPDLVAFSVLTPIYQWSLAISRAVKARIDVPIIFGGVHPSAVPEVCLENECVDYVCVGEGEAAMVALCEALADGAHRPSQPIPNLSWWDGDKLVVGNTSPFNQELDDLPYFDKDLWVPHIRIQDNWMTMTSRGCPYRCTFCFNNFFAKLPGKGAGRYLRQRSVESVMGELVDAKQRFGIKRIDFEDDIFTTNKEWIRTFLAEYRREIDLPFQCLVHPRYIDDDLARWLKDAGCQHVQMGVQSADEEFKRKQLLRMEKESHMSRSLHALGAAGLDTKLDHMLGLPGEPLGAQEKARELYAAHPPRRIQTFWLTHLPGVELTKRAVETGDLSEEDYERVLRGETGRFHTRSAAETDEHVTYRRYELMFRLMPLLPRRAQKAIRLKHIPKLSGGLATVAGSGMEVANSIKYRDAEAFNYLRHYAHTIRRLLPGVMRRSLRAGRRAPFAVGSDMSLGSFGSDRTLAASEYRDIAASDDFSEPEPPMVPVRVELGSRPPAGREA